MNRAFQVFKDQFISNASGFAATINSQHIAVAGNRAMLAVTTTNTGGTNPSVTYTLQGSYDGLAWKDIASTSAQTVFGYAQLSALEIIDHAFLRVKAVITGTSAVALFDATIAVSSL